MQKNPNEKLIYAQQAFEQWRSEIPQEYEESFPVDLGVLIGTIFFASLATEEGAPVPLRVVFLPEGTSALEKVPDSTAYSDFDPGGAQMAWVVLALSQPQPLTVEDLKKIGVAIDPLRSAVVVGRGVGGKLEIQGVARQVRDTNGGDVPVIVAPTPGVIQLYFRGVEEFRYEQGRRVPPPHALLSDSILAVSFGVGPVREALRARVKALVGRSPSSGSRFLCELEMAIARILRALSVGGRGGLVALLPGDAGAVERESVKYRLQQPNLLKEGMQAVIDTSAASFLAALAKRNGDSKDVPVEEAEGDLWRKSRRAQVELAELAEDLGRFAAVDNALLLSGDLEVIGSGYPIPVPTVGSGRPIVVEEALDLAASMRVPYPLERHGSRHRAAASFAYNERGVAFVVSADGPIRCMLRIGEVVVMWKMTLPLMPTV